MYIHINIRIAGRYQAMYRQDPGLFQALWHPHVHQFFRSLGNSWFHCSPIFRFANAVWACGWENVLQDSHREGNRTSLHRHTGLELPFESRSSQLPPRGPLHTTRLPCTNKWAGGDEHASFRSKRPWRGAKSAGRKFASCRFSSPPQGHIATNTTISDVPLWRLCQGRFTTPCISLRLLKAQRTKFLWRSTFFCMWTRKDVIRREGGSRLVRLHWFCPSFFLTHRT